MKNFALLIATNNLPPMEHIISHLSKRADRVQTIGSFQEILSLISTQHVACIVFDTAFLIEQNNPELLSRIMHTTIPSVTIIRRNGMRFFAQVYHPPIHEYDTFPVELEHISFLVYSAVAQFRKRVPDAEVAAYIQQQFITSITDYPAQHLQFAQAAVTIPIIQLLDFTQRMRNEPFPILRHRTSFRRFYRQLDDVTRALMQTMRETIETAHSAIQISQIAQSAAFKEITKALYQQFVELQAQLPKYTNELQRGQRGTYQPQRAVPRDMEIITSVLSIAIQNNPA